MTEKEKMLSGEMYNPLDPELDRDRHEARLLFQQINGLDEDRKEERNELFSKLLPNTASGLWIEPPFYCDYGYNIYSGKNLFMNFDCCILDVMPVRLGNNVMMGPKVQLYTATHPLEAKARNSGREFAKGITIGNNVWIGGGAVICPGVTIGDGVVIGAGSVVTRDLPDNVFAAGSPARVFKQIDND